MRHQFEDSGFARLYLWIAKAKYTMGILFLVFVLFYLFFGIIGEGPDHLLDFFTAIQMMFACFFIGIAQQGIVPKEKLTKTRGVLWITISAIIILSFSLVFGWFFSFPPWCFILFLVVLIIGMAGLLLGHYIELHRETRALNRQLEKFQNQANGEG
ncbi:hypothetical protein SDC9_71348 [bioreactor metagenome]|uniref:DUF3021 domain-containing protein n=1 Tax=bioreactor metagenome TaxID=1076179 RepID=A0A644Y8R6_9ZZZZ|nr:hypothetical protein [Oscillibacter sp.]MEA4992791.1 hypothetical protein [Oscillibacter sp.]